MSLKVFRFEFAELFEFEFGSHHVSLEEELFQDIFAPTSAAEAGCVGV
jgi:hypothetical protein